MKQSYKKTMFGCFVGYIVQAIVNNFVPLLFVTFEKSYNIPLSQITLLITVNFIIQLFIDMLSAGFIDKIGYRASVIIAHFCSAAGLILLTVLPDLFADAFVGIVIGVTVYAIGGGLIEVLISPMVEACPTDNKEKTMSLLHSFYCWGHMGVVLISTAFFAVFGIENWKILALIWSAVPIANAILFVKAPIFELNEGNDNTVTLKELFTKKVFWVLMLMMVCSGAAEQSVSQWASAFAEQGLGVSKAVGDLAGPTAFAALMGVARVIYGKWGHKLKLSRFMELSCLLCIVSYLLISLVPNPIVGLVGCALCGFSVGILWPGTYSTASTAIRGGTTAMFAMLALGGDLGCSLGPTLAGFVSSAVGNNLRMGILSAVVFPILLLCGLFLLGKRTKLPNNE